MSQGVGEAPAPIRVAPRSPAALWQDARRYLDKQFAPPQMAAMGLVVALSYLLYGRIARDTPVGYELVAAAVTVVILFLQIRLVEDLDIHWSGGELLGQLGRRRPPVYRGREKIVLPDDRAVPLPPTLWRVTLTTTAVVAALNAPISTAALIAGLAGPAVLLVSYVVLRNRLLPRVVGLVPFFEGVPLVALLYVYFAWRGRTGVGLSPADVVPVVGIFWVVWEFWKFSRGIGKYPMERTYGLSHVQASMVCLVLLAIAFGLQVLLWSRADLSTAYLVFAAVVTAAFPVFIARTMGVLRRDGRVDAVPRWADLTFAIVILVGIAVQLVALAF